MQHAGFGIGEVEQQRLRAQPLDIPADRQHQLQAAQGVKECPRPAVFAQAMPEAIGERDAEILLPQRITLTRHRHDDKIRPRQRRRTVGRLLDGEIRAEMRLHALRQPRHRLQRPCVGIHQRQPDTPPAQLRGLQQISDLPPPKTLASRADNDDFHVKLLIKYLTGSVTGSECPAGTPDNSPPIYWWVYG